MQHDVEYSVCKDEIKRKMKQTKCCGKTEENNKTENVGTAHSSWLHDSTQYTDILLHNIDKIQQQKTFKNWNDTNRSKKKRRRIKELFISACLVIWRQQNQNSNLVTKSEYQNTRERHLHLLQSIFKRCKRHSSRRKVRIKLFFFTKPLLYLCVPVND